MYGGPASSAVTTAKRVELPELLRRDARVARKEGATCMINIVLTAEFALDGGPGDGGGFRATPLRSERPAAPARRLASWRLS
jgi:hypothetical protein